MDREPVKRIALSVLPGGHGTGGSTGGGGSQPAPVPRASTEDGTGEEDRIGTEALPVVPGTVVPITVPERVGTAVRRLPGTVAQAVRELWLYPDRLIHSLWNGQPESMAAHYRYMISCAWVPEEVTGKKAAAWKWAGIAYHVFIAWPLKAFAKALDAAAGRPLLMLGLIVPVLVLVLLFVL